ncbi:hypothetical protein L1887_16589 [Cichorium endivia]|nr:hypothetical protein L1887_16589 [Cichorium endivia]
MTAPTVRTNPAIEFDLCRQPSQSNGPPASTARAYHSPHLALFTVVFETFSIQSFHTLKMARIKCRASINCTDFSF